MNILVAEDDRLSREMLRQIIESDETHTVTLASDGEEAWKLLREEPNLFDVGVFDINMPKIDGLKLIERMRSTPFLKSIPAILCTAAADRNTVARASTLSVSHYIIKPYSKHVILEKLQTVRGEIARQGLEDREAVLKRLALDDATYRTLTTALLDDMLKWVQLSRYTADLGKFASLIQRAAGFRGAVKLLGLAALAGRLEEIEFTAVANSGASNGQPSPLILAQILPVFEALEEDVKRVSRQLKLV